MIPPVYSPILLDHFENPRNAGELPAPTASVEVTNPVCGDILRLEVRIENERIAEARFRALGCVASIACSSYLTEILRGKSLEEAAAIRQEEIVGALGGLPSGSLHAAHLVLDGVAAIRRQLAAQH